MATYLCVSEFRRAVCLGRNGPARKTSGRLSWQDQGLPVEGTSEVAFFHSEEAAWPVPFFVGCTGNMAFTIFFRDRQMSELAIDDAQRGKVLQTFQEARQPGGTPVMEHTQTLPDTLALLFQQVTTHARVYRRVKPAPVAHRTEEIISPQHGRRRTGAPEGGPPACVGQYLTPQEKSNED